MPESEAQGDSVVTVAITRRVIAGKEEEFARVLEEMTRAASGYPGHLGAGHIRPAQQGGEHVVVYRFDSDAHLEAWQSSSERARLLERIDPLIEGGAREERSTGLEFWFEDSSCPTAPPPRPWKQALVTWIGLFPTVYVLGLLLGDVWEPLPDLPRVMLSTSITVILMTAAVMPLLTRALRRFLRPEATRPAG